MKSRVKIDINEISEYYIVTDDGRVWTKVKNRWLKPHDNMYGYISYSISKGVDKPRTVFAHTLVALRYIGLPPTPRHEIDHIDNDKANNHYSNLQWVTHSQNQLKAYAMGRESYWLGKSRGSPSIVTRMLMANAKKKTIRYNLSGESRLFESIEDAAAGLGTYRKRIYLCIKSGLPFKGGYLSVVSEGYL